MSKLYNHAFALGFSLITADPEGASLADATAIRCAILRRLQALDDCELLEAIGCSEDTFEETDEQPEPELPGLESDPPTCGSIRS